MLFKELGLELPEALIEVILLWAIFYSVLKSVKGTRAMQVVWFVTLLYLLIYLCRILDLTTVYWLLSTVQIPLFIALVILYAPELRRAVSAAFLPGSHGPFRLGQAGPALRDGTNGPLRRFCPNPVPGIFFRH